MKIHFIILVVTIMYGCRTGSNSDQSLGSSPQEIKEEMVAFLMKIRDEQLKVNPLDDIKQVEIDCSVSDSLLKYAYEIDQNSREGIDTGIADVDGENQQTVVSILEKCDWPNSKESIDAIWTVLQHSNIGLMSLYYPKLKELEKNGLISSGTMALMEDRLLMFNGQSQIFGTQVLNNKLYDINYPEQINELRKSVELEPIEDYTKKFGFEFKIDDYIH